jgi:cleavage and polyadenylation specificity factor subunit 1
VFRYLTYSVYLVQMTTVNHDLLFLGSRQGDSYLIRFSIKSQVTDASDPSSTSATSQADVPKDFIDPEDFDADVADLVDVMLHSKKARLLSNERAQFPKWALQVCDVLPSLAAVSSVTLERSLDTLDVEGENTARTDSKFLELVCASGRGKSGSLSVVQQAIRPSVLTSLELPGCQAVWSVFHSAPSASAMAVDGVADSEDNFQKYLIISRANSTMVLETGEAISEVTNDAEFRVDAPTLDVANMFGKSRYVQVHEGGFYLVDGLRAAQIESLPDGVRVVWSSICDPYLMTILSDDSIQLFVASQETGRLKQLNVTLDVSSNPISTCCVFQDTSSVLPFNRRKRSAAEESATESTATWAAEAMQVDDEEDKLIALDPEEIQLYNVSSRKTKKRSRSADAQDETAHDAADEAFVSVEQIERPYYAAIARSNGSLEIYELPSFKLVWHCTRGLCDGTSTMVCETDLVPNPAIAKYTKMPVEIAFAPLGSSHLPATLIVLYDTGELALFRSFAVPNAPFGALPLGLRRIHSEVLCHNLRKPGGGIAEAIAAAQAAALKAQQQAARASAGGAEDGADADDGAGEQEDDEDEEMEAVAEGVETRVILPHRSRWTHHRISNFGNVQGRSGVFICGVRPIWLYCERDHVRTFLMDLDGPVQAFTPFHNVNCLDGFIYYASSSAKLKISQQKPGWSFELPLPILRVPLRATPINIAYDPENEVRPFYIYLKQSRLKELLVTLPPEPI